MSSREELLERVTERLGAVRESVGVGVKDRAACSRPDDDLLLRDVEQDARSVRDDHRALVGNFTLVRRAPQFVAADLQLDAISGEVDPTHLRRVGGHINDEAPQGRLVVCRGGCQREVEVLREAIRLEEALLETCAIP